MDNIKLTIKEDLSVEVYNFDKEMSTESNLMECIERYYKSDQVKIRFIERPEKFSESFVGDTHIKLINLLDPDISDHVKIYQNDFFEAQICVPFRARGKHAFRKEQLFRFVKHIQNYMETIHPSIRYRIVIIEQDNEQPFNRGYLLNIGFFECEKRTTGYIKYYIHHNCDLFPNFNDEPVFLDYSYPGPGVRDHFGYIGGLGGISIINRNAFKLINGFPNNCLVWGADDTIIKQRCERFNIKINRDKNYNKGIKEENHERDGSFNKLNQQNNKDDNLNWKRNGITSLLYKCKIKEDSEFKMGSVNIVHYLVDFRI